LGVFGSLFGQAVGGEFDLMLLIDGAVEQAAIQLETSSSPCVPHFFITSFPQTHAHLLLDSNPLLRSTNQHRQIQLSTFNVSYIKLSKRQKFTP
jgi:hypothetical protein